MLITNHVLSGAVIGAVAPDMRQAAGLGFLSHFVLDGLPHFGVDDEHLMKVAVPDGLLGLAAIGAIARAAPRDRVLPVLAGVFGACLPDVDKPATVFFGRSPFPRWFDRAHARIQDEKVHRFTVELASAAVFTVALMALLPRRPHRQPARRRCVAAAGGVRRRVGHRMPPLDGSYDGAAPVIWVSRSARNARSASLSASRRACW